MTQKKRKALRPGWLRAVKSACVIALAAAAGSCSNSADANNPIQASITLNAVTQNPFCNSGTLANFVNNGKGEMMVEVIGGGGNPVFHVQHRYFGSNASNPSVTGINTNAGTNNHLDFTPGTTSIGDQLHFNAPKKNPYTITVAFIQWGATKPNNQPLNTSSCANPAPGGQTGCFRFDNFLEFAKGTFPNFSNTSLTVNSPGFLPSCVFF